METRTLNQLRQEIANALVPLSLLILLPMMTSPAQVTWGAICDFEFRKGGEGSALERNELVDGNPQFSVHRFQLFLDASIDDHVAFTAKLANNVVKVDALKEIELQLAYVSFTDIAGRDLNGDAVVTDYVPGTTRAMGTQLTVAMATTITQKPRPKYVVAAMKKTRPGSDQTILTRASERLVSHLRSSRPAAAPTATPRVKAPASASATRAAL